MENNGKRFYLTIRGQEVEVSEEVYRAYIQPVRAERRRKQRAFRCKIKGERLNLVRCNKDCRECPYALSGHNALGNSLSLDRMKDEGVDIEDRHLDVEQNYIADEEKRELYAAIKKLTPRQKEIEGDQIYLTFTSEKELTPEQIKIKAIADAIIKEGTGNSYEGNWISNYSTFGADEQFVQEHKNEIADELESREEVSDVMITPDGLDVNYYMDFVVNALADDYEKDKPKFNRFKDLSAEDRAYLERYAERSMREPTNSMWDVVQSCTTIAVLWTKSTRP